MLHCIASGNSKFNFLCVKYFFLCVDTHFLCTITLFFVYRNHKNLRLFWKFVQNFYCVFLCEKTRFLCVGTHFLCTMTPDPKFVVLIFNKGYIFTKIHIKDYSRLKNAFSIPQFVSNIN